jgi:hypothetical protein
MWVELEAQIASHKKSTLKIEWVSVKKKMVMCVRGGWLCEW